MFEFNGKLYAPKGEYITTPKEYQELQVGETFITSCDCMYKMTDKGRLSQLIKISEKCSEDSLLSLGEELYYDKRHIVDVIVDAPELSCLLEVVIRE